MENNPQIINFRINQLDNIKKAMDNINTQLNSFTNSLEDYIQKYNNYSGKLSNKIEDDIFWLKSFKYLSMEDNKRKSKKYIEEINTIYEQYYKNISFIYDNIYLKEIQQLNKQIKTILSEMVNFNPPKINSINNSEDDINININESPEICNSIKINESEQQKSSNFYGASFISDNEKTKLIDNYSLNNMNNLNNISLEICPFYEDNKIIDDSILYNEIISYDYKYENNSILNNKEDISLDFMQKNLRRKNNDENDSINFYKRLFCCSLIRFIKKKVFVKSILRRFINDPSKKYLFNSSIIFYLFSEDNEYLNNLYEESLYEIYDKSINERYEIIKRSLEKIITNRKRYYNFKSLQRKKIKNKIFIKKEINCKSWLKKIRL